MAFEFDCPQYYDFEKELDVSNPEAYFDSVHAFSPTNSLNSKPKSQSVAASDFPVHVNSEPYKNTRLSLRKSQNSTERFKSVSSKEETSSKIAKVIPTFVRPISKIPASTVKGMEPRRAPVSTTKPLKKLDTNVKQSAARRQLRSTVPTPFSFATDKRSKTDLAEKSEYKPFNYETSLRRNKENQVNDKTGPVRPVPDRLLRKRKTTENRTLAEEVLFQHGRTDYPKTKTAKFHNITVPVTPYLRTACRSRRGICEEKTAASKSLPHKKFNLAVSRSKPVEKPQTLANHPVLRPRATTPNNPNQFKARPVPVRILQGITGLGVRPKIKLTEAHSPAFVLTKRAALWKQNEETKNHEPMKRLNPTNMHDAAINENQVVKLSKKMASQPVRQLKTQNSKFMTELQERARTKANEWQKKMEEEMKVQREALLFKARPCTVTRSKPFQPIKSNKPLTKSSGFQFQSDLRIQHRKKFVSESEDKPYTERATESIVLEDQDSVNALPIKQERLSVC